MIEIVDGYVLTLAHGLAPADVLDRGGSGSELTEKLAVTPLARAELEDGWCNKSKRDGVKLDALHLSRYDGTNYVQWFGRGPDGRYYPFGRLMLIVRVTKRQPSGRW